MVHWFGMNRVWKSGAVGQGHLTAVTHCARKCKEEGGRACVRAVQSIVRKMGAKFTTVRGNRDGTILRLVFWEFYWVPGFLFRQLYYYIFKPEPTPAGSSSGC